MAQNLFNLGNYFPNRVKWQGPDARGYPWPDARMGGRANVFPGAPRPPRENPFPGVPPTPTPAPQFPGPSPTPVPAPIPGPQPSPVPPVDQYPGPTPGPGPAPGPRPFPGYPRPPRERPFPPGPTGPPLPVPTPIPGPADQLPVPPMQPLDPSVLYGILSFLASHPALGGGGQMLSQYATPGVLQMLQQIRGQMPEAWLPQIRAQFNNTPYGGIL